MASLVLGAVGGYFFGPIGFMVGSAIGSMLDPAKGSEGPRLTDKHLTGSTYGTPIPIIYGTMRTAGEIIWTTPLIEHKHKSGGKGGPSVTTYTYTASFDALICESNGNAVILGCQKIWADGTLIYDLTPGTAVDNTQVPVTFYYGGETQLPDPTEEATLGVGNAPPYRGMCRAVFANWDLGNYGNRIPQLTFEVFTVSGTIPWRVSSFNPYAGMTLYTWKATYSNGVITAGGSNNPTPIYYQARYTINGTAVGSLTTYSPAGMQDVQISPINTNTELLYVAGGGTNYYWYAADQDSGALVRGLYQNPAPVLSQGPMVASGNFLYGVINSGVTNVVQLVNSNGSPGAATGLAFALDASYSVSTIRMGNSDTGHIYIMTCGAGPVAEMWKINPDMTLNHFWSTTDCAGTALPGNYTANRNSFYVYKGMICFANKVGSNYFNSLVQIDPVSNALTNTGGNLLGPSGGVIINLSGGLMLDNLGVFSLDPPPGGVTLASIVSDISQRSGLATTQFDVTSLTDIVPGYTITRQSSGVDNIAQLRMAYFFDAVESSGVVRFVKRGGASAVTIVDNDLAAQAGAGGTAPPVMQVKRTQEVDLPATLYVNYIDTDTSYQQGSQYARRLVTKSQADATVSLSVAFNASTARTIASKNLFTAWMERNTFTFSVSSKHKIYEPTDVVVAHGYTMRLTNKRDVASGVIEFDAVATAGAPFLAASSGVPSSGFIPPSTPGIVATYMQLLDVPLVNDSDYPNGYYAALAPNSANGTWRSGSVFKSTDGGTTYVDVGDSSTVGTYGVCNGTLGPYTGGNFFDETNSLSVTILGGSAPLASTTADGVRNGSNLCAVGTPAGWEILQFRTATLTATQTYLLSGLLRGRKGTEPAIGTHGTNEQFVMLQTALNINGPYSEVGSYLSFKGLTAGQTLAQTNPVTFTNNGAALLPYSPCNLGGGRNAGLDVIFIWTRRTRIGGSAWLSPNDVPLSETTEAYVVTIYSNSAYNVIKRTVIVAAAQTYTYTSANQVTDFGSNQSTVYWTVAQQGTYSVGTAARGVT